MLTNEEMIKTMSVVFAGIAKSMNASIFSESTEPVYIIVGILSFILGCALTVFCFKIKKWQYDKDEKDVVDSEDTDD